MKVTKVSIPYQPRKWALKLHSSLVRWIVLVIHRRGGKTTAAFNHLQRDALLKPNTRYAYIAPTFKQAKRIVWGMAKFYAQSIPGVVFNESELLIKYPGGSEIMVVGSDNPDSLRGIALWGAFLDEYPLQSPLVFTEIITKCLADHQGYCIFGGTPKGKGHFHRVYKVALKNEKGEWCLVYKTIDESLKEETGETIENLRKSLEDDRELVRNGLMTEDEFQQEWYNSFEAAIKGAVYLKQLAFMRQNNRITSVSYNPHLPVYTVWDLGISKSDAMSIGFYQRVNSELRMIHYYESIGTGLPHCIKYVKELPYIYGKHFAPHDITHKEQGTGKTRHATAEALGITFEIIPKLSIEDGIDLARAMLLRLWVDEGGCSIWIDLIGSYHFEFDERTGMLTKTPIHDFTSHAADMTRYTAIVEEDMRLEERSVAPTPHEENPDDEYVGHSSATSVEELEDGEPERHPMFKGIDIGKL